MKRQHRMLRYQYINLKAKMMHNSITSAHMLKMTAEQTYSTENMHSQSPHPASRILKYVGSAVHQADGLGYDSECSFAVLSGELWGRCVLCAPGSEPWVPGQGWGGRPGDSSVPRGTQPKSNMFCFFNPLFSPSTWKILWIKALKTRWHNRSSFEPWWQLCTLL